MRESQNGHAAATSGLGYSNSTLSQTGNWLDYNWFDAASNDLSNYDRTHNAVNEVTAWTKNSTSVGTLTYDDAGQMTQNDRYQYVYDGFGRLVALKDAAGNPIATYGYNGLGFRIWEQPNGGDKRYFCYDERWRIVATFDDTNATPTRRVIHHSAGLAGMGGSSYIDSVILEDANETGDMNLETRYYPLQNWRADVVCVGKLSGGGFQLIEAIDYDTYGNAVSRPPVSADFDQGGGVDSSDYADFYAAYELGEPEADADLDGGITPNDVAVFLAAFEAGILGPSRGSGAYSGVIAGYAGYVRDRWAPDLYHVRHRVYDTRMGTWTKRDPLGYVDGSSVYLYSVSRPICRRDPSGLFCTPFRTWLSLVPDGAHCVATSLSLDECLQCCGSGTIYSSISCRNACVHVYGPNAIITTALPMDVPMDDEAALTDVQACEKYQNSRSTRGGFVLCRGKKKVSCFGFPKNPKTGQPLRWSRNAPGLAKEIITECVRANEDTHHDDISCDACPDGKLCRTAFVPGRNENREECISDLASIDCFNRRRSECDNLLEPDRQTCKNMIDYLKNGSCGLAEEHCGVRPRVCY